MRKQLLAYAVGVWVIILFLNILGAAFRQGFLIPVLGEGAGRALETLLVVAMVWIVTFLFIRAAGRDASAADLLLVGVLWLALTLTFEFSFGHFVEGLSVQTMLADYNVLNGRLFILVVLSAFIAPVVCGWALAKKKR